jgi:predicted nuclease of predicted toxin-antitoxin system
MKLYLDDNMNDRVLVSMLRRAGHSAVQPTDVGLTGASDVLHLEYAIRARLVLLTKDSQDFKDLHQLVTTCGGQHPGILVVHHDDDPRHDMKVKHIPAAVTKLEQSGLVIGSQVVVLNQWR